MVTQVKLSKTVRNILKNYESDNPGTKTNLARILMNGRLAGTGKMVILPVDQGFEHGPVRSFAKNPEAYDPHYHYQIAVEAGLNAYAAPLGMLEAGADSFAGEIPTILKMNSANLLYAKENQPYQAITSSIDDALKLGCSAIGFTIYPGSDYSYDMMNEIRELALEAKSCGLVVVIWSYPRGAGVSKNGETAVDVCAYAAHIAALLGAHIIKVKPPTHFIENKESEAVIKEKNIDLTHLEKRIAFIKQSCFNGRRLVVFSGGTSKSEEDLISEVKAIKKGGGDGSIIGRNCFQRPREKALSLLSKIINIYL